MAGRTFRRLLPWLRVCFGLSALTAIGWQLGIQVRSGFSVLNFFSYFTNLSNLFAGVVLLLGATRGFAGRARSFPSAQIRFISAVNMAVVSVVFALLLREVDLGSLLPWINFVLHYVMPLVVVLDWLFDPPTERLGTKQLLLMLIFPVVYLSYVLVRGAATGWVPYPFLNPATVGGHAGVAWYSFGIAVTFLVAGWMLLTLGNRLGARRRGG